MSSLIEKLNKVASTKESLRVAINTLNGSEVVTNSMPFDTWADYVKVRTPSLSGVSFDIINEISLSGKASEYWNIGDSTDIPVNGETLTFEIMGFNHDDLADGSGKAGITFGMKHLMRNTRWMNSTNINSDSFVGSDMYDYLNGTFYNGMPSDLKSVIKSVNKLTGEGGIFSTDTRTDTMKIFLFSEQEVFGSKNQSIGNEGSQYSRFTTSSARIKKLSNGSSSAEWWWLRSPTRGLNSHFCCVTDYGNSSLSNASNSQGVCAGFCI